MRLVTLLLLPVTLAACVSTPDGTRVRNRTFPVAFGGFHSNPSTAITLEALNPATSAFERFASTTSGASPITEAFGVRWYPWRVSALVPEQFWIPGATGAMTTVRSFAASPGEPNLYLGSFREGAAECMDRMSGRRLTDAQRECAANSSPSMVLCTMDFTPVGSRRICPRRLLDVIASDGSTFRRVEPRERTATIAVPASAHGFQVGFRGDAASFVDVFDAPFHENRVSGRADQQGLSEGSYVRIFYPRDNGSVLMERVDPAEVAASLGISWGRAATIRAYDRGACSVLVPWPRLLSSLIDGVLQARIRNPELAALRPWGNAVLTPILRPEGRGDAIGYTQRFSSANPLLNSVLVKVVVGLTVEMRDVRSSVDDVQVEVIGIAALGGVAEQIKEQIRTTIPRMVDQAAQRAALGGALDVHRVYARPDGVEFVLAETESDLLFAGLLASGLCERPVPAGAGPIVGRFGSVFELP